MMPRPVAEAAQESKVESSTHLRRERRRVRNPPTKTSPESSSDAGLIFHRQATVPQEVEPPAPPSGEAPVRQDEVFLSI